MAAYICNDLLWAPSVLIRSDTFPGLHWDWWRKLKNCASFYGVVFLNYKLVSLGAFFMVPSCSFYSKWFPQDTSCAGERRWCQSGRWILFWVGANSIFPPAYHKDNHHFISIKDMYIILIWWHIIVSRSSLSLTILFLCLMTFARCTGR